MKENIVDKVDNMIKNEHYDDAIKMLDECDYSNDYELVSIKLMRIRANVKNGNIENARMDCFDVLRIDPDNHLAHMYIARMLHDNDEYEDALKHINLTMDAFKKNPDDIPASAFTTRATIQMKLGEYEACMKDSLIAYDKNENGYPLCVLLLASSLICEKYDIALRVDQETSVRDDCEWIMGDIIEILAGIGYLRNLIKYHDEYSPSKNLFMHGSLCNHEGMFKKGAESFIKYLDDANDEEKTGVNSSLAVSFALLGNIKEAESVLRVIGKDMVLNEDKMYRMARGICAAHNGDVTNGTNDIKAALNHENPIINFESLKHAFPNLNESAILAINSANDSTSGNFSFYA